MQLLAAEGLLSLKEVYVDGTKIESVANRYAFVWGNVIKTNREKIAKQLEELWQYAQSIAAEELDSPEPPDFTDISAEKVKATAEKIDAALRDKPEADKKAKLSRVKKDWPENLEKYQAQEETSFHKKLRHSAKIGKPSPPKPQLSAKTGKPSPFLLYPSPKKR